MPNALAGSPDTIFEAVYQTLTATFTANDYNGDPQTWTAIQFAVDELNGRLVDGGDVARLSVPVGVERQASEDDLAAPDECPHIRIVTSEGRATRRSPWGLLGQGHAHIDFHIVSYLTQGSVVTGDTDIEHSLDRQCSLWVQALIHALRRPDGYGPWRYAQDTLINLELIRDDPQPWDLDRRGDTYAMRLDTVWRAWQDCAY